MHTIAGIVESISAVIRHVTYCCGELKCPSFPSDCPAAVSSHCVNVSARIPLTCIQSTGVVRDHVDFQSSRWSEVQSHNPYHSNRPSRFCCDVCIQEALDTFMLVIFFTGFFLFSRSFGQWTTSVFASSAPVVTYTTHVVLFRSSSRRVRFPWLLKRCVVDFVNHANSVLNVPDHLEVPCVEEGVYTSVYWKTVYSVHIWRSGHVC